MKCFLRFENAGLQVQLILGVDFLPPSTSLQGHFIRGRQERVAGTFQTRD